MSASFKVPIDTPGEILSGDMKGWFIKVIEADEGGAYLVLQSKNSHFGGGLGEGFDDWVLPEDLDYYFEMKRWEIRWA
jgi:hypothetical protein